MLVAQSCPTLYDPMECSPPGSSVHDIFQARILEWVIISFSRGSSQLRDQTQVSCTAGRLLTELQGKPKNTKVVLTILHVCSCVFFVSLTYIHFWFQIGKSPWNKNMTLKSFCLITSYFIHQRKSQSKPDIHAISMWHTTRIFYKQLEWVAIYNPFMGNTG